jgi:integrase
VYQFREAVMARPFIQRYETAAGGTRYRAWYYDAAGRKVGKVHRTRRDAEAFLRDREAEAAGGTLADTVSGRVTVESVWNERRSREEFAAATLASQDNVWRVAGPILGRLPITSVKPAHVEAVLASIDGPAAKAKARSVLVAVFNYAIAEGRIAVNPAKARRRSRTRAAKMATRVLSAEERRRLTSAELRALVGELPERYRALVELMARVGLRPGEAYALTVGQLEGRELRIDRTVDGAWTKTGEQRTVVLPAVVAEMLTDHVARYSDPADPDALIFPNRDGGMLDRNSFRHVFQRAAIKVGVNSGYSPNDLRHTAVAFAVAHGANVYDVQAMLGHAKPSITLDVYGFMWEGSLERLADALDEAIRGSSDDGTLDLRRTGG